MSPRCSRTWPSPSSGLERAASENVKRDEQIRKQALEEAAAIVGTSAKKGWVERCGRRRDPQEDPGSGQAMKGWSGKENRVLRDPVADRQAPEVFLPYQQKWSADDSPVKVMRKIPPDRPVLGRGRRGRPAGGQRCRHGRFLHRLQQGHGPGIYRGLRRLEPVLQPGRRRH